MARFLFIIAQEGFRDEEFKIPHHILSRAGIDCDIAAETTDLAFGKLGMQVTPNLAIAAANAQNYQGICIVGGPAAPLLANNKQLLDLIKEFFDQKKIIAAICSAPTVLARAGVLQNRQATVFPDPEYQAILKESSAILKDETVCIADNVITANGPAAASAFAQAIKQKLLH